MEDPSSSELPAPLIPASDFKTLAYLGQGWHLFASRPGSFIAFTVLALLINLALSPLRGLGTIAAWIINPPLWAGPLVVALKLQRRQPVQTQDFLQGFRFYLPLLLFAVVSTVLISLGLLLLILPGIYLAVSYIFATLLILDRGLDFWPAMELSRRTVLPHWFEVCGFVLLLLLLNLAGLLLLGIGLLVSIPWSLCALTAAYSDVFGGPAAQNG